MKPRKFLCAASILLSLSLAAPVQADTVKNVENHPISAFSHNLPTRGIARAIVRAGTKRGWIMQAVNNNTVRARLEVRAHTAIVDITFDRQVYNITYVGSQNLNYRNGRIHRNYNRWVRNLENDIAVELSNVINGN
ncbi:hypothetical protein [Halocynthiibacter namhaensis]|uniref:hypothetical protein n=1 Tax=Halocynthiibacter namhaensis TaxID=1290553 RepID=UPI00057995F2|nr:hypothetical protein [Halocynthiibacter namhaensis]